MSWKSTVCCKYVVIWMGLDIVVCNLLHMVAEIKMPCLAADNMGCRLPMDYSTRFKCSQAMSHVATAQHFCHLPLYNDTCLTCVRLHKHFVCSTHWDILTDKKVLIHWLSSAAIHSQTFHVNSTEFTCSRTQSAQTMVAMCLAQTVLSKL